MTGSKTLAPDVIASGEVDKPPFAVLPDPRQRFLRHAQRFEKLAPGHQLESYLRFLAKLAQAQHDSQEALPPARLPPADDIERAHRHGMPPVSIGLFEPDAVALRGLERITELLLATDMPDEAKAALQKVAGAGDKGRGQMMRAIVLASIPANEIAEHVIAAAAVQVHFSRLAAGLDAARLTTVAPGACPACGGGPVASVVVETARASGHRYCCCSLCGTMWNVARIQCVMCGGDKNIAYRHIEGVSGTIKAETCESCEAYVKILHQDKDPSLDPVADDVASLGLDLLMREAGFHRGAANPFLLGY